MNTLFFGDNLSVLRNHVKDESVDLVYLDPPFNPTENFNVLFEESAGGAASAQVEAFRDMWKWGDSAEEAYEDIRRAAGDLAFLMNGLRQWLGQNAMMAYLAMMAARLLELRRALKPTGSLYLHCDPMASHYLKLILDAIFGHENFRNEIIWKRTSAHSKALRWGPIHDTILFVTKGAPYTWNKIATEYDPDYVKRYYRFEDGDGRRYRISDLTGSGIRGGESGESWGGFDPTAAGRHWAIPGDIKEALEGSAESSHGWLELIEEAGWLEMTNGWPHVRRYLDTMKGQMLQDIITDIKPLSKRSAERLGYPTQKPLSLLDRIIRASSREGDVVLDPFCGCGTTVDAAENLKRKWIGIDVTHYAVTLIEARLAARHPDASYTVQGRPEDVAGARDLARRDKHQFQWWAAWRVGAQTYREEKRGADRGIDGNILFKNGPSFGDGRIIVSVKGGEKVGVEMVRDLRGVIEREEAEMGILVTLAEPTKPMRDEALQAGPVRRSAHGRLPRLQVVTIADLLEGRPPKLPPLPLPEKHPVRAPRRRDRDQLELLLPFPGEKVRPEESAVVDPRFIRFG